MSAVVLLHLADPARPASQLCEERPLRIVPADYLPELPRKVCGRCEARARELAGQASAIVFRVMGPAPDEHRGSRPVRPARAAPTPPPRDRHPLVGQLEKAMGAEVGELAAAFTDAAVLGTGWLRIRMCPTHGPELERVDPARIIVNDGPSS